MKGTSVRKYLAFVAVAALVAVARWNASTKAFDPLDG
jgi:hypothetical protein